MTTEEIIRYVMSFLGGGFAVAVGNWLHAGRAIQLQQELSALREELKYLYGPLSYITRTNEQLFSVNRTIHGVYGAEFIDKKWSNDPLAEKRVHEKAEATLELANAYIDQVVENNKRALEILEQHWHFADLDDIDDFSQFKLDCIRLATEVRENMGRKTPDSVYRALGEISYMRPALIERVAQKVEAKQLRIEVLLRPWWKALWCSPTQRSSGTRATAARRSP